MIRLEKGTFCTVPIKMLYGLHPTYQVVFMWLCHHANESGVCFPSLEVLCKECSMSHATISMATKELLRLGYITKRRRRNSSCIYQIIVKNVEIYNTGVQESSNAKIQQCKNLDSGVQEFSNRECKNLASNYNQELKPEELKPSLCTFDKFWKVYPIKKSKASAEKIFSRIKPSDDLFGIILRAIDLQGQEKDLLRSNGAFCPEWKHASTWLNGKCWEDEVNLKITKEVGNERSNDSKPQSTAAKMRDRLERTFAEAKERGLV